MFGRSPRALVLWAAALVVAAGTATLVASDLAALHRRAQSLGPERPALVATRSLTLGHTLTARDLRARRVHGSQLPPGVLAGVDAAIGRVVTVPVVRGGFVTGANVAPRRRTGLDGALPPGSRAMRVVVRDTLRPRVGAAVDVLATFEPAVGDASAPADSSGDRAAAVIAAGVTVVAAADAHTAEGDALGVTLLVSPRQAKALAFATTHGRLALALVPPEEASGA